MSQLVLWDRVRALPLVPAQCPGHPVADPAPGVLVVVVVAGGDGRHLGPVLDRDPLDLERRGLGDALQDAGGGPVQVVADVIEDGAEPLQTNSLLLTGRHLDKIKVMRRHSF